MQPNQTDKINEKFQKLLKEGQQVFQSCGWHDGKWYRHPPLTDYLKFRTESLNLIGRVCGEKSAHFTSLKKVSDDAETTNNSYYFTVCFGILQAAYADFTEGFLFDLRSLINAELLGDFLEQAETLVKNGYHIPAASLAGAVLEDSLRKLSDKHSINFSEKTSIDPLNNNLAKAGVYNKLIQKEITAKADIRNNADHGNYDKFSKNDVEDMIKWIQRFESEYLG